MTSPKSDPRDERLLRELKAATADLASVPAGAREAAQATFTWRKIDEELLLALCFDSAVDDAALVRGSSTAARSLSFENDDLGVEIEIHAGRVTGQLLPPQPGSVRIVAMGGAFAQAAADATGCFVIDRPPHGPLRLECRVADAVMTTEWVPF